MLTSVKDCSLAGLRFRKHCRGRPHVILVVCVYTGHYGSSSKKWFHIKRNIPEKYRNASTNKDEILNNTINRFSLILISLAIFLIPLQTDRGPPPTRQSHSAQQQQQKGTGLFPFDSNRNLMVTIAHHVSTHNSVENAQNFLYLWIWLIFMILLSVWRFKFYHHVFSSPLFD